mmetsp:Transcript_76425/g.241683  ORF Transcript_76425/g.241683 Transcript_76425/m.241683 type:complete len:201 (+) Transcript_76425:103-705(+)
MQEALGACGDAAGHEQRQAQGGGVQLCAAAMPGLHQRDARLRADQEAEGESCCAAHEAAAQQLRRELQHRAEDQGLRAQGEDEHDAVPWRCHQRKELCNGVRARAAAAGHRDALQQQAEARGHDTLRADEPQEHLATAQKLDQALLRSHTHEVEAECQRPLVAQGARGRVRAEEPGQRPDDAERADVRPLRAEPEQLQAA